MKKTSKYIITLMLALLAAISTPKMVKAAIYPEIDITKGVSTYISPFNPLNYQDGIGYTYKYYHNTTYKGDASATYDVNGSKMIVFKGITPGHISFSTNQSTSYAYIVDYRLCVHNQPTDIQFTSSSMSLADEIYLYEGETATISCTTLPYNSAIANSDQRYQNAIQGNWCISNDSSIVTAQMDTSPGTTMTIKAVKAGDTTITVEAAGCVVPKDISYTGNMKSGYSKALKVHVRKKPTITLTTDVTHIAFNRNITNAITANVSNNSNSSLMYTWKSSKSSVLKVTGSGNKASLSSYETEGTITIACELKDDVHMYNPSVAAIKAWTKIQVSDYKLDLSSAGIKDGGSIYFDENQNTLTLEVNEAEGVSQSWSSTDTNVATVSYEDGKLVINRTGVGIATINCISSTGNTFSFSVVNKAPKTEFNSAIAVVNGMGLSWNKVKEAEYYNIYRATEINGKYTKIGISTSLLYTDTNMEYGKTYYYKVTVVPKEAKCESDYSDPVSGVLLPAIPEINKITTSYGQVKVSIDGILYDGFILEIGKSQSSFAPATSTQNKLAYIKLEKGTYYARIRAYTKVNGNNVYSEYSKIVKFSVSKDGKVAVKASVKRAKIKKATRVSTKKIKVKIKKIKGAKYQIKYSTSKKFKKKYTKSVKSKKNTKTLTKLKNKKYYIKVRAYKKVNGRTYYGKWSKVKIVKKK